MQKIINLKSKQDLFLLRFLCLLIVLIVLSACSAIFNSSSSNDGILTIYTAQPEAQARRYLEEFTAQNPNIEVNFVRESIANLTQRLLDEQDNPQADVIWGLAVTNLLELEWRDMLKAYAPAGLEDVDERFQDQASPPHWVGINVLMAVFCVNTEKITELDLPMPESWQDLLRPVYSDHIVMASPLTSGTGYIIISSILDTQGSVQGWEFLDGLDRNIAFYSRSAATACDVVGEGEYAIGLSADARAAIQRNDGKPVGLVFPAEGTSWDMRANALVKKKVIKPAAMTFLDWAISDSSMNGYAQDNALTSVQTDNPIPDAYPADIKEQLLDLDFPWAAANRKSILIEWEERYGEKLESE